MIIKIPNSKDNEEVRSYIRNRYIEKVVTYIIDSKYRTIVKVRPWLEEQLQSSKLKEVADKIQTVTDYDKQVILVLKYIRNNITYISDLSSWTITEKWQTVDETLTLETGDCEDGTILAYLLCRLKGVPINRLMIFTGNVNGGGHCWLGYKPTGYLIDYTFIDWCYWYNSNEVSKRNKFHIENKTIYEHSYNDELLPLKNSNYKSIWFAFNEDASYTNLTYTL